MSLKTFKSHFIPQQSCVNSLSDFLFKGVWFGNRKERKKQEKLNNSNEAFGVLLSPDKLKDLVHLLFLWQVKKLKSKVVSMHRSNEWNTSCSDWTNNLIMFSLDCCNCSCQVYVICRLPLIPRHFTHFKCTLTLSQVWAMKNQRIHSRYLISRNK